MHTYIYSHKSVPNHKFVSVSVSVYVSTLHNIIHNINAYLHVRLVHSIIPQEGHDLIKFVRKVMIFDVIACDNQHHTRYRHNNVYTPMLT